MAEQRDIKVFISWSGDLAKEVATSLRKWLPLLFDRVTPWMSDTDIAAGQRGLDEIDLALTGSQFGIIVVTATNQHQPWLMFEAGHLSKAIGEDQKQRVVPLIVDLEHPTDVTGPLAQFQGKLLDQDGLLRLVRSLAQVAGIGGTSFNERFKLVWRQLNEELKAIRLDAMLASEETAPRTERDMLEEALTLLRAMHTEPQAARRGGFAVLPAARPESFKMRDIARKFEDQVMSVPHVTWSRVTSSQPTSGYGQHEFSVEVDVNSTDEEIDEVRRKITEMTGIPEGIVDIQRDQPYEGH